MPGPWQNRRNMVGIALASTAVVGLLTFIAYRVYQEIKEDEDDNYNDSRDIASDNDSAPSDIEEIEDVINIADELHSADSGSQQSSRNSLLLSNNTDFQSVPKKRLTLSARGILIASEDPHNKWSGNIRVLPSARMVVSRLSALYDLYIVVVIEEGDESVRENILAKLADASIIDPGSSTSSSVGDSIVWVDDADRKSSTASSAYSNDGVMSVPSSEVSDILRESTDSLASRVPRENVLFCQTEEGKAHLVRHLLTLSARPLGSRSDRHLPSANANPGYAAHIDTNIDVVSHLAPVLRCIVYTKGGSEDGAVGSGDLPGILTAYNNNSTSTSRSSTGQPLEDSKSIEIVDTIFDSKIFI